MVVKHQPVRAAAPRQTVATAEALRRQLAQANDRQPKYVQFREALGRLIDEGRWSASESLPTETELAAQSGLSLGTVQRGIGLLVEEGRLVRMRGQGTFVSDAPRLISRPFMHLLFLDDDGAGFLPIRTLPATSSLIDETGRWSRPLGQRGNNIFRVDRVVWVADAFRVLSRFYINADRYAFFTRKSADALTHENYKLALLRELGLAEIRFEQALDFGPLPPAASLAMGVKRNATGCCLHVLARTRAGEALYVHEMFIPPNDRTLHLPPIALRGQA